MARRTVAPRLLLALVPTGLPLALAAPESLRFGAVDPPIKPGHCEGKAAGVRAIELDECTTDAGVPGQELASLSRCVGPYLETLIWWNASDCKGPVDEAYLQRTPLNRCIMPVGSRGVSVLYTCNETAASIASWSSEPQAPTGVSCDSSSAGAGSLHVSCQVDARDVDEVSFEVSLPSGRPFLSFTARAGPGGEVRASIPGLQGSTAYRIMARSHRRGEQEGNPDAWSTVSKQSALCATAAAGGPRGARRPEVAARRPPRQKTRWLEAYRLVGGYSPATSTPFFPDFLDEHNAADLAGLMGMISIDSSGGVQGMPLTRYCVEVLDAQLPGVITAEVDGKPRTAPFADFASCNQGVCRCMHQVDRSIAHLPAKQISELCTGHPPADYINNTCQCPSASMALSKRYVGRAPIPLPFRFGSSLMSQPMLFPPDYPFAFRPSPMGEFLSFPAGGRCPLGARPGEGNCTWQTSPAAHTVYVDDLVSQGFNVTSSIMIFHANQTTGQIMSIEVDYDATVANLRIAEQAFASLRAPPCGAEAAEATAVPGVEEVVLV